jgi:hypothetical protein
VKRLIAFIRVLGSSVIAAARRTWRFLPLVVVLSLAFLFIGQRLAQPSSTLSFGETATVSFVQGPRVLLMVRSLKLQGSLKSDPLERVVTFNVSMRLSNPADQMTSGDALASYCSVIDRRGIVYPSDLALSSRAAKTLNFVLQGGAIQQGRVVALIPTAVHPSGVLCQFGVDVETWRVR